MHPAALVASAYEALASRASRFACAFLDFSTGGAVPSYAASMSELVQGLRTKLHEWRAAFLLLGGLDALAWPLRACVLGRQVGEMSAQEKDLVSAILLQVLATDNSHCM